jgi:hypothetical protein
MKNWLLALSGLGVRARPGETLALWCAEPGHRAQGMHTVLRATTRP